MPRVGISEESSRRYKRIATTGMPSELEIVWQAQPPPVKGLMQLIRGDVVHVTVGFTQCPSIPAQMAHSCTIQGDG